MDIVDLIVVFLIINAIFWSLAPHESHCKVVSAFGIQDCPPHWTHLTTGLLCFAAALAVQQRAYLFSN